MKYPLIRNNFNRTDLDKVMAHSMKMTRLTNGPRVEEFEKAWSS